MARVPEAAKVSSKPPEAPAKPRARAAGGAAAGHVALEPVPERVTMRYTTPHLSASRKGKIELDLTVGEFIARAAAQAGEDLDELSLDGVVLDPSDPLKLHYKSADQVFTFSKRRVASSWVRDFGTMRRIRALGKGSFGVVSLVEDPSTHELIALKSFMVTHRDVSRTFIREIGSLVGLAHPSIIPFVGYCMPTDTSPGQIGTKFAANGSLRDAIEKVRSGSRSPFMDDTGIAIIVAGIVTGMKFMHSKGLMHCNLKPENILLEGHGYAQIGDLGSAQHVDISSGLTSCIGTPHYMAPEMYSGASYTKASDVYSFALILYELVVGEPVFPSQIAPGVLMKKVIKGIRPDVSDSMNRTVHEIITRGWSVDPAVRPTFDEIYEKLTRIGFRLTTEVVGERVDAFISQDRSEAETGLTPATVATDAEDDEFKGMEKVHDIGWSSYARVTLMQDPLKGDQFAVKSFQVTDPTKIDPFIRELEAHKQLTHPCVLSVVDFCISGDRIKIGTQFAVNGSLADAIVRPMSDTEIAVIVCGVVVGMTFLHSKGVVHRNLKPENILLDEMGFARIGGVESRQSSAIAKHFAVAVMFPRYLAPEICEDREPGSAADVYSFALILYELLVGSPIFGEVGNPCVWMRKMMKGERPELPELMEPTVKDIIARGWARDPSARGSFADIGDRLKAIDFKLTPAVDTDKIHEFLSYVRDPTTLSRAKSVHAGRQGQLGRHRKPGCVRWQFTRGEVGFDQDFVKPVTGKKVLTWLDSDESPVRDALNLRVLCHGEPVESTSDVLKSGDRVLDVIATYRYTLRNVGKADEWSRVTLSDRATLSDAVALAGIRYKLLPTQKLVLLGADGSVLDEATEVVKLPDRELRYRVEVLQARTSKDT